jgi:hypothetical protein
MYEAMFVKVLVNRPPRVHRTAVGGDGALQRLIAPAVTLHVGKSVLDFAE